MAEPDRRDPSAATSKDSVFASTRVVVEGVRPAIDGGRAPIKRVVGDEVEVEVDLVADGHDVLGGALLFRREGETAWQRESLSPRLNDRYRGSFTVDTLGRWQYAIEGWVDEVASWRHMLKRKLEGGEDADVAIHLRQGATLLSALASRAPAAERGRFEEAARVLDAADEDLKGATELALDPGLAREAARHPNLARASRSAVQYTVEVERPRAAFSAWYEFFPRSCGEPGAHGTFRDCEERLEYAASMGFDIIYLPPIHPIGKTFRKGRNNSTSCEVNDVGSPWAIGAPEGGHKSIHPDLGTLEDFRWFVKRTRELGMEVALDIAFQASPDHPYVREHPEWFVRRPDGSIQYAENPPKKYQDIYPIYFESEDAEGLWRELRSVFQFWIDQGVKTFRVDNPHTKSLAFWRWCIGDLRREHPDLIFLSEAFTRPKLMYALAKMGFTQSYTYFTWRNTAWEFRQYLTELTQTDVVEFFRPNFWPNTPDILPEHLQYGGRPAFIVRLVLAATLSGNYGIYGPAYELMDAEARPGSGEYLDNEKYELKAWNVERPDSLRPLITRINAIRRENPALASLRSLCFHPVDNDALLAFSKQDGDNLVLVVANLDFHYRQSGFVQLNLAALGIDAEDSYQVHDLLGGGRFLWSGERNYIELDPHSTPVHVFQIKRRVRTEQDFDYFA